MLAVAVSRSAVFRTTSVRPPLWAVMSFSAPTLTLLAMACGSGVSMAMA